MTISAPEAPTNSRQRRQYVAEEGGAGITIASRGGRVGIDVDPAEDSAVRRAVGDLGLDLTRVCGVVPDLSGPPAEAQIIVGTIGRSVAVDEAIKSGRLDIAALEDENGELRWEGYLVALIDEVLYLVGTDRRGTVFAVYDFTEAIGVSPWHWWGDVPIRHRDHVTIDADTQVADWPSVRHRGIFLNDEEELYHWARAHTPDGTIGPTAYARIFELILRLKGNYLWAAMHVGAFNDDPENGRLANEMGVVIGTQHCDMLLRSNEHEFRPWVAQRGEDVKYDYSIPGRNRELLREYWHGSVEQNSDYEVTWSVGMRGVHDSGFITSAIDDDPSLTEEEKVTARVRLLETVIHDQRALLSEQLKTSAQQIPQLFIPYKEVLPIYDAGLDVPDDITMVWANDSFGHIRRFPDQAERQRSGGHGLYYHSSYWSNYTTSYLATSSTPLALMKSELRKAWDGGIRRLWVNNIGGLKPLEIEMEFFLRSAWEAGRETTTDDVPGFTAQWIDAKFSGGHGARAGALYAEYYQLNDQRKIEHLTAGVFPQTGYGDEAARRLQALRRLYQETNAIMASLPADERDAFFQLFAVKIHMAYLTNAEFYYADRSSLTLEQSKPAAADRYLDISRAFARGARALIEHYNQRMAGGRWNGMFTPHEFPPPVMPMYPAASPALTIGEPGLGVTVWGDAAASARVIEFWPDGIDAKWIEVHNTGGGRIKFEIECDPWIVIGPHDSTVETEIRIPVRIVRDSKTGPRIKRSGHVRVTSPDTGETIEIRVTEMPGVAGPSGFQGWLEADGYVSIDPSDPDRSAVGQSSRWASVAHLGRYGNAVMQPVPLGDHPSGEGDASLEFDFHLSTPGAHLAELHRLPTLDSTGRIRVGVSVDEHPAFIIESPTTDEYRGVWSSAIQDNIERLSIRLPLMGVGPHRLRLHAVDDYVALSKIVIYTDEPTTTNLGPDFSARSGRFRTIEIDPDPSSICAEDIDRASTELYGVDPGSLPPSDVIFADRTFWRRDTTFLVPPSTPEERRVPPRSVLAAGGKKDRVYALGTGVIRESDGAVAFEAENALANSADAWMTSAKDDPSLTWTHTQAESNNGDGLAMHVRPRGMLWQQPSSAPGLHYVIRIGHPGSYRVWLLVKFDDDQDDSCVIAVDGVAQPIDEQHSGGEMCEYGLRQRWLWAHISDIELTTGDRTFSVLARKSGLRVDRIYLTLGDELPPIDALWTPSSRIPSA